MFMKKPETRASRALRWVEAFLLGVSLGALAIWAASIAVPWALDFWSNRDFDQQVREHETPGDLHNETPAVPSTPAPAPPPPTNTLLGRLTIPRLDLTEMVREGDQERTLSLALGHIPGTALPGQPGNVGVAGHRDKIFRGLRDVQKDDLIRFETLDGTYLYRVQETEIVMPDQVSVLRASQHSELTLVTCYPFYYVGSAPQRFIVKAREVSSPATIGSLTASRKKDD